MDQIVQKLKILLDIVKIPEEKKAFFREKLPTSTSEQLVKLEDNLMRQLTSDVYFELLEKAESTQKTQTDDFFKEVETEVQQRLLSATNAPIDQMAIDKIQQGLADIADKTTQN